MAKGKAKPNPESPMWFKVIAVLFGILPAIIGVLFLLAGQLDLGSFIRFFSPAIVLIAAYFILKSIRKTLSNWDYLLLIVLLIIAWILF